MLNKIKFFVLIIFIANFTSIYNLLSHVKNEFIQTTQSVIEFRPIQHVPIYKNVIFIFSPLHSYYWMAYCIIWWRFNMHSEKRCHHVFNMWERISTGNKIANNQWMTKLFPLKFFTIYCCYRQNIASEKLKKKTQYFILVLQSKSATFVIEHF